MKSIFHKLLLTFISLSVISILCITVVSYYTSSSILNNTIGVSIQQTVTQINTSTEMMLNSVENMVNTMLIEEFSEYGYNIIKDLLERYGDFNDYEASYRRKNVENYMSKFASYQRYIEGMHIIGDNELYFSSANRFQNNKPIESFQWFEEFKNSDKSVGWTGLHNTQNYITNSNSNVISYMKKVNNRVNTKNIGILWVDINERWFSNIYDKMGITPSSKVFILDNKGIVISHSDRNQAGMNAFDKDYLKPVIEGDKGYFIGKVNNKDMIIAYDIMYTTQWKTVYMAPVEEVMKPYIKERDNIILAACILLIVTAIAIFFSSYNISLPLKNLMILMKKAASGDFKVRATVKSKDELGQLYSIFNKMVEDIDNLIKQVYEARAKQKEAELIYLQSQINPHFIYNTLQTIKWLADMHHAPEIGHIALSLSKILRFSIKADSQVSMQDEINNTIDYITIQKYRYEDRFTVEWDIGEAIYDIKVPSLIMQPIVENAIMHGLELKRGMGLIKIQCKRTGQGIFINVTDNGAGITEKKLSKINKSLFNESLVSDKASIGLKNISDRLKLMYGNEALLQIDSLESQGTSVNISIPLKDLNNTNQIDDLSTLRAD